VVSHDGGSASTADAPMGELSTFNNQLFVWYSTRS